MFNEIVPLNPIDFFAIGFDCRYFPSARLDFLASRYELPNLSEFHGQGSNNKVALGWNEKGLFCTVDFAKQGELFYPDFRSGDSVELFIDTRDVKSSSRISRFCHHFFFLREPLEAPSGEKVQAGEITRFRGEEGRPLAESSLFEIEVKKRLRGYLMAIFIPKEALFGFAPEEFDRMGFNYRINQSEEEPHFFSASDLDFPVENQPSLWASSRLTKEKKK